MTGRLRRLARPLRRFGRGWWVTLIVLGVLAGVYAGYRVLDDVRADSQADVVAASRRADRQLRAAMARNTQRACDDIVANRNGLLALIDFTAEPADAPIPAGTPGYLRDLIAQSRARAAALRQLADDLFAVPPRCLPPDRRSKVHAENARLSGRVLLPWQWPL